MLEPTKTKFFKYTDKDAFAFKGEYLDITTLFDAVLVNGFNNNTPQSFSITNNVLTIIFSTAHGFENYSVVKIENADVTMYNREFRVRNVPNTTSIEILVDETFTSVPTNYINIIVKTAPLGYTKKFESSGKRVYTSSNWCMAMKVDDYQHPDWNANWSRFARIQFANDFSDVDTPLGYSFPSSNPAIVTSYSGQTYKFWTTIKIAISRTISNNDESTTHVGTSNRAWYIVGDDKGFYFIHGITNQYPTNKNYYHSDYIGTINAFNKDLIPDNSIYFSGFYKTSVSSTSVTETDVNDLCRHSYSSVGNYCARLITPTIDLLSFRLSPLIHSDSYQGISGQYVTSATAPLNSYEYLGQDVLVPVTVDQLRDSRKGTVGFARGMQGILTEIMSTRPERNSDFTIKSRVDNSCVIYLTHALGSGIVAFDIVKDW